MTNKTIVLIGAAAVCAALTACGTTAIEPGDAEISITLDETTTDTATSAVTTTTSAAKTTSASDTTAVILTTTEETTEATTVTTTTPAPENYEWYRAPYMYADDVNVCCEIGGQFNYGYYMDTGYMILTRNGLLGLIDSDGNELIAPAYENVFGELNTAEAHYDFSNSAPGEGAAYCTKNHSYYDAGLNRMCPVCNTMFTTCDSSIGYLFDAANANLGSYSMGVLHNEAAGTAVLSGGQIPYVSGLTPPEAVVARNFTLAPGENGAVGTLGSGFAVVRQNQPVTEFIYSNATDYKEGVAAFCRDGRWGYINLQGEVIIPFEYDGALCSSNSVWSAAYADRNAEGIAYLPSGGFIALNQNGKAGFADITGKEVIPVGTFAAARPVHDGLAWVKAADTGMWGVIKITR